MTDAASVSRAPFDSDATGTRMYAEAAEAPARVALQLCTNARRIEALGRRLRALAPRAVVTAGRGSSDNAATFAKYLIETRLATLTSSAALSVTSVYTAPQHLDGVVFLAISQSGKSPDLLAAVSAAKAAGAFTIALVNAENSPLAAIADEVVPLCAGPELSVAATKSYLASASAILHLVTEWSGSEDLRAALDALPDALRGAFALDWTAAIAHLKYARDLYVIGRGLGFGLAQEAALKLKETCGLHAEAFSAAEVRHGPMALVQPGFPVFAFSQDDGTRADIEGLAESFAAAGADLILAGIAREGACNLPVIDAHAALQPILMAESFYRMTAALARARGLDPDRPPHLNKVTETF